jgi:hypothetical protein
MSTKRPTPNVIRPKKRTLPAGPLKPLPPRGSSTKATHPSPLERVELEGRRTKGKLTDIRRKGGK